MINRAYDFFSKPENEEKLQSILKGNTVKLSGTDLRPESDGLIPIFIVFVKSLRPLKPSNWLHILEQMSQECVSFRFMSKGMTLP